MTRDVWRTMTGVSALVLILLPHSSPGEPSWRPLPPADTNFSVLQDLESWIGSSAAIAALSAGKMPAGLRRAIAEQSSSFEVFRSLNDDVARRRQVDRLPYGAEIFRFAERFDVDPLLLAALVETESNFSAHAVSPRGAVGLVQLMPETALDYGVSDLEDPAANLELGARYLGEQIRRFDGNLELALSAYNAGPQSVSRHDGMPPYSETRRFVDKVLSIYVRHCSSLWTESSARAFLD